MSGFVKIKKGIGGQFDFSPTGKNRFDDSQTTFLQFTPGHVVKCLTNGDDPDFESMDGIIGAIKAISSIGNVILSRNMMEFESKVYIPLLRGIQDHPTQGDQVLLCSFGGKGYYIGPINTEGSPNFNVDHTLLSDPSLPQDGSEIVNKNPLFPYRPGIIRLQKVPNPILDFHGLHEEGIDPTEQEIRNLPKYGIGDLMLEGRYGNSIRIGSRGSFPSIIISNGRQRLHSTESWNDGSLMAMVDKGSLSENFDTHKTKFVIPSNDIKNENPRPLPFEDFSDSQVLLMSDKLIFGSRVGSTILSSQFDVDIGAAGDVNIFSRGLTRIESKNVYIGWGGPAKGKPTVEPLVLGDQLYDILNKMIDAIGNIHVGGVQPNAVSWTVNNAAAKSKGWTELETLKGELDKMLSWYHKIEINNQPTKVLKTGRGGGDTGDATP